MVGVHWPAVIRRAAVGVVLAIILCLTAEASAPVKPPARHPSSEKQISQSAPLASYVEKIRFSSDEEAFRLVFDMTAIPAYTVNINDSPFQVEIDLSDTVNRSGLRQMAVQDPFVEKIQFADLGGGRFKAYIPLKLPVMPRVSVLGSPPRLVVDLLKTYERRTEQVVAPGVIFREITRGRPGGPIKAYVLEVDFKAGNTLRPVLSNDSVAGVETLSEIADRLPNIAIVNGPYFMRSGEIIGLMKIDRMIVSTPDVARTSLGVMPDGKLLFDTASYSGYAELPDGTKVPIDGVNRSRGDSELILYNPYYAYWTLTSGDGMEYTVRGDRVTEVKAANSLIPDGAVVLSANGRAAWQMSGLKLGSRVKIVQKMETAWDRAVQAVGAGPCLVKDGQIYLTTEDEQFGGDVAGGRAPRTAVGVNAEGRALLVVVDGRRSTSVGLSLAELAQFMLDLGAVDAMNMDGGGSSEMIVDGQIVNEPSDGRERRIGAGIAVVKTKPGK